MAFNTGTVVKFSDDQKKIAFHKKRKEIDRLWQELQVTSEDAYIFLNKLMFELYEADKKGRAFTMGQACTAIPAKHMSTCKKYVKFAKSERLITYKKHPIDKRKILVVPTSKLKCIVEDAIILECEEIEGLAKEFHFSPIGHDG